MPKSRGRRKGAKSRPARRSPRPLHPADLLLREARDIIELDDVLTVEMWASSWLGRAWSSAALTEREPEHQLCMQVSGRACATPSPHALGAIAALARVAPAADMSMLAETVAMLAQTQPVPAWHTAGWTPAAAWRAVDVYDSERVLLIDYDGPHPHTLLAQLCQVGGLIIDKLVVLEPGVATGWDELCEPTDVPMPMRPAPVTDVLGDLAHALRVTDMTWPRNDDEDFLDTRALAWSRCRDHLPDWPDHTELPEPQRRQLIQDFATDSGRDDQVSRSLAELLLDYGEGYIGAGPLCWSPGEVMVLLTDWLPRKAILDADQRAALPDVLRRWLRFALTQRDISPEWIGPVVDAVDTYLPFFRDAFDNETAWGPAKQVAAALTERGIDLTDPHAIDSAIHQLNAEQLAHQLLP